MKEILIKIDKEFISNCVYQENWGDIVLDEKELKTEIAKLIKKEAEEQISSIIRECITDIVKKDLRKEIKEQVKGFVIGMSSNELFFRDEFRSYLVEIAKENKTIIDSKIKAFLQSDEDMRRRLFDALGTNLADRFLTAIVNGKID